MKTIKLIAAFIALAALGRAESTASCDRVIELPPVVVQTTRLSDPVLDVQPTLDEMRAKASQSLRVDLRHMLAHSLRRMAADQRHISPAIDVPVARPTT